MHIVECPHCRRKFKVPSPVADKRMKCGRCGQLFVGSSVDSPEPAVQAAPSPTAGGTALAQTPERPKRTNTSTLLLAGCFLGVAGTILLGVLAYYKLTHPRVIVKTETGQVKLDNTMPMGRARRMMAAGRSEGQQQSGESQPAGQAASRPGTPDGRGEATVQQVESDPKLSVTQTIVSAGPVGDITYVCGRVLSAYEVALQSITFTVYVDGKRGPERRYAYVPAGGSIDYSICLGSERLDDATVKVAAACRPAGEDLVIWSIPSREVMRSGTLADGSVVWTGVTRNPSTVSVQNVKIYCDYFADDGVQAGSAIGALVQPDKIGRGQSAAFRIACSDLGAEAASRLVARVVANKY